jgi:dipeptidyl aminopeptidase/acylaminoacyl peptidase
VKVCAKVEIRFPRQARDDRVWRKSSASNTFRFSEHENTMSRLHTTAALCALFGILLSPATSATQMPRFSLAQVLSYPSATTLVKSADGTTVAFAIDQQGKRSIWVARAPAYQPKEVVLYANDDGQDIRDVQLSRDGSRIVYVYGNDQDPSLGTVQPHAQVCSVDVATGTKRLLGTGGAPAVSPDGSNVAFERSGAVWIVPVDGSAPPKQLFYDLGSDSSLQWSPTASALAFVSTRGDHSFIGVYRGADQPLEFLEPSVMRDLEPRWSPDGTRIAFARTPGEGGVLPSPLRMPVVPWSIWVARVSDGAARAVWRSPNTSRASFPTEGGDVDLNWAAHDSLIFVDAMDNWPHIYAVSANGGPEVRLTAGAFAVTGVAISSDLQSVFYSANTGATSDDVDRSHLYRVDIATQKTTTLSSGESSQWWPVSLADGDFAFLTATAQRPPLLAIADQHGNQLRMLDDDLLPRDFPSTQLVVPAEVTYKAPDGTFIHAQLFRARGMGRQPGIIFVHGGPMRQMLLTWTSSSYYNNSYALNQYLVSRGFDVLSVNYRSGVDYGHDFQYAVRTGWTGASEYQDVLAGARWLQQQSYVDRLRIGIWGGSWGGYLTALALARNSDVFKAGVDYSGVHDLMHDAVEYFRVYQEGSLNVDLKPWLQLAWNSSPVASVSTWRSPALLIQGDDDPEVSFHQMVDLVPRLEKYHVPFQAMVLPNEAHSFLRYDSWLRSDAAAVEFFERNLH